MHGWIILDKPYGMGSTQAVGAVKRVLREAGLSGRGKDKVKVGHGGTLDPLATGVLPIALGEATKLTGQMLDASKVYEFTVRFGVETDTLDGEGEVVATSNRLPTMAEVEAVLPCFTGAIEQMPPAYSALKVDGRRAYDLARAGEEVELKSRQVTIHDLTIRQPFAQKNSTPDQVRGDDEGAGISSPGTGEGDQPQAGEGGSPPEAASAKMLPPSDSPSGCRLPVGGEELLQITLTAHVSKGTYIRSLARDIARALDSVGHVTMLRRTRAGPFGLDSAISLDILNEIGKGPPPDAILPFEAGLADIPALDLDPASARLLGNGQVLNGISAADGAYWARDQHGTPLALIGIISGEARVTRGFNLDVRRK